METEWRYAERILHVDLGARLALAVPTGMELKRSYVGGAGFVARLLKDGAPGDVALAGGPLSDGLAGRLALGVKLPDGKVAVGSLGGRLAAALKEVGYDAVVLRDAAASPCILRLGPDGVTFVDGASLWGADITFAEAALSDGGQTSLVIGPAAEHQVPFATLAHEGHHAGGGGVAAALGAKRVKAVVLPAPACVPSRCDGCTLHCPGRGPASAVDRASALGLDAPTAARLAALAERLARAGLLPAGFAVADPLAAIAYRTGVGSLLADGEAVALTRLGPAATEIAAGLPAPKRRHGVSPADLVGTCQRTWRERPGQVLREALTSTMGLLA